MIQMNIRIYSFKKNYTNEYLYPKTFGYIVYNVWGFLDVTPEGVTCARLRLAHVTPSGVTSKNPHTLYCLR